MDIKRDRYGRPRVYLEEDCPVEEISVESQRERGASSALPPIYFLHVWWARRPLTVSRVSIIGSLLPAGYDRSSFLELIGIPKGADPVGARKKIDRIKAGIERDSPGNKYGYPRAFSKDIPERILQDFHSSVSETWGEDELTVLDSFAGGGSIPFEACRVGLNVIANDLNPVSTIIQKATIEYPKLFGPSLEQDINIIGNTIMEKLEEELVQCFPRIDGEYDHNYIWVRTLICNKCNLVIPLSPTWQLDNPNGLAFVPSVPSIQEGDKCHFTIKKNDEVINVDQGTIKRGVCTCPRCGNILDGDFVRAEAKAGRMGLQLAVVQSIRKQGGRRVKVFRNVTEMDLEGIKRAEQMLQKRLPRWHSEGMVPIELLPEGLTTRQIMNYGITQWWHFFSPRQLLVHLCTLEALSNYPWEEIKDEKKREALRVYLQLALDKTLDYNSLQSRLNVSRAIIVNTFDRHDYAPVWSPGEIDGAGNLFRFGYSQVADAYAGICKLLQHSEGKCHFINGDASNIGSVHDKSVSLISIDPPYYDNVMYSESANFFYVWSKRGLGDLFPEIFAQELTDNTREAVANPALFKRLKNAAHLAARDYEAKMFAAFKEMHRVLHDDGVMTVMFTHKKVEAWDTMAYALLKAGFMITASWPIHTESEHSLHQAKKNAAASTILLVCRKRPDALKTSWWDEVQIEVDDEVRKKAEEFATKGLRGQDTSIACFGPALQVISENWPVKRKDGTEIRPEEALDRARITVSAWFMDRIAEGKAEELDAPTRYYILAWYMFQAREFRYDEARKLGLSLNVEVEDLIKRKMLQKKGDFVTFLKPCDRAKNKGLRPDIKEYDSIIDLVQAAIYAYSEGQSAELKLFYQRTEALAVKGYEQAIGYLLDVLPRTAEVEEYKILNDIWESNPGNIRRKVRNTDPTGEKQGRLDQFSSNDESDIEESDTEETDEQ